MTDPDRLIRVGKVIKPHGVEGTLSVEVHTEFPAEQFAPDRRLRVEDTGTLHELTVVKARAHQQRLLVDTEEITSRDEAERLRDRWLLAEPVEDDESHPGYFEHELVGLTVRTPEGDELGVVASVQYPDANPVFEIESPRYGILDFPAHEDFVETVSLDDGILCLRMPTGWEKLIRNSGDIDTNASG